MSETGGPRFSTGRSILYAVLIVSLFFGATEGALRILGVRAAARPRLILRAIDVDIDLPFMRPDSELFWSPRPGWHGEFGGRRVTITPLGLRAPDVPMPKPAGRRRIACFGDSITFGLGVGDDESYPARLSAAVSARGVDVVNAGVTGYTSEQVLGLLRRLAPELGMDVATFCVGWNDAGLRPIGDREFARRLRAASAIEGWLDHLYIYRAAKGLYLRAGLTGRDPSTRRPRVSPDEYRENVRAIVDECRRRGIRPVFVALPRRRRAGETSPVPPYPELQRALARELDVPLVLAPELAYVSDPSPNETYFLDTLHLSASGNALLSEAIAQQLVALGLI